MNNVFSKADSLLPENQKPSPEQLNTDYISLMLKAGQRTIYRHLLPSSEKPHYSEVLQNFRDNGWNVDEVQQKVMIELIFS